MKLTDSKMHRDKEHLPFLDGIRGIAILSVFLFHSLGTSFGFDKLPWAGLFRDFDTSGSFLALYPLTYGHAGVAVFFVVSGFCIHLSHQRSRDKGWACFFNRRFFRIYPPYLVATCVFFFIWPWGSPDPEGFSPLAQLGSHLFAVHNLHESGFFGINPSFWSVAVEIQLYAIYPLLVLLTIRLGWRKSLILAGFLEIFIRSASSAYGVFYETPLPRIITSSPFAYWFSWSLGAYLADCYLTGKRSRLLSGSFCNRRGRFFSTPAIQADGPLYVSFVFLADRHRH